MESYVEIFGGQVAFVELRASLEIRLERNHTEQRLLHKASKRDLEWSDSNVREMETQWAMTSANGPPLAGELLSMYPHLILDTSGKTAEETAERVLAWVDSRR